MLITDNAELEIWCNGHLLELSDNTGVDLRFNNVIFNPTKFSNKQAEYSFSFDIPATPNNNKALDFPNVMSSSNKFSRRFDVDVVAAGTLIFTGTMILNSYKKGYYNVNLVSIKVLSLEDIFGDDKLSDLEWYIPFLGVQTINYYNRGTAGKYFFPLASYGVFQKSPYYVDEVAADYTSKFLFDKWNQWYYSSFFPSLNMMEVVKRCFEQKGYKVKGDAFADPILNGIYLSTNLSQEQIPDYNYGNERLGTVKIDAHWSNGDNKNNRFVGKAQDLTYQYEPQAFAGSWVSGVTTDVPTYDYNDFDAIEIWDMLDSDNPFVSKSVTNSTGGTTYMFDPNECVVIVPAAGFYEIGLEANGTLKSGDGQIRADKYWFDALGRPRRDISQPTALNARGATPIEIHLLKNYKEDETDCELIYGKYKTVSYSNGSDADDRVTNTLVTCFPHESLYNQKIAPCSNAKELISSYANLDAAGNNQPSATTRSEDGENRQQAVSPSRPTTSTTYGDKWEGYYYRTASSFMAYDPVVCDNFLCGLSTLSNGVIAARKNGKSWTKLYTTRNDALYEMAGYDLEYIDSGGTHQIIQTNYNKNLLKYSPVNTITGNTTAFSGGVHTIMWLNRNDVLSLKAIQRKFSNEKDSSKAQTNYYWDCNVHLTLRTITKDSYAKIKDARDTRWGMATTFDKDLRLGNFLNNETTMASFVEDVQKAFNLDIVQDNREVTISRRRVPVDRLSNSVVDLNDRVNLDTIESKKIDYPSKYSVAYSVNKDEYGFVQSCPIDKQEEDDWEKYADSGYSVIKLDNDSYNIDEQKTTLGFSYDWFADWTWYKTNNDGTQDSGVTHTVSIPVVSKDEYLVDEYKYDDAAKKDGYSLKQRMWFRTQSDDETYFWTASQPRQKIYAAIPVNTYKLQYGDMFSLSYKDKNFSILDEYFDVLGLSAANDEIDINVYLSVDEYMRLKNGALVKVNDDLYRVLQITGYDPTNRNKTKLSMMKMGL